MKHSVLKFKLNVEWKVDVHIIPVYNNRIRLRNLNQVEGIFLTYLGYKC